MSEMSIPFALDPHGREVPIKEAIRFKTNYYTCPECEKFVDPRKGEKRQYFAHKQGELEEVECELSSDQDVERMVDELRTSDVEQEESQNLIRTYVGEEPGGSHRLFGVIPSIDWDQLPPGTDVDELIEQCDILSTEGIKHPPTSRSFHPSEPEVIFELDPQADRYQLSLSGPGLVSNLDGEWTTGLLQDGDLFVGDQTRARRFTSNRQVKNGEWVYIVTDSKPPDHNQAVSVHSLGEWTLLAFPARPETENLLEDYGTGLRADNYGFESDVLLPAEAHPTADKPIIATPETTVLIAVTPAEELDPVFEIVSIPKRESDTVELDQTGPGNTRFYKTTVPQQGSKRISVHQRNSSRHRLIHLHADDQDTETIPDQLVYAEIGLVYSGDETETMVSPIGEQASLTIESDVSPVSLPSAVDYIGPAGLEVEVTAYFPESHSDAPFIRRSPESLESVLPNVGHWVQQGCTEAEFAFDGMGSVALQFSQNMESATAGGEQQ